MAGGAPLQGYNFWVTGWRGRWMLERGVIHGKGEKR